MQLSYKPLTCISIKSVTLIIEQKELSEYTMEYKDGLWSVDIQLPSGEYIYRFLLNGELLINDPFANFYLPNKEGTLWSVLRINHENKRLYNNTQYNVEIIHYSISNRIMNHGAKTVANNRMFNILSGSVVSLRYDFINTMGLHTATIVWIAPGNTLFDKSENYLLPEGIEAEEISLWFNLNLQAENVSNLHGLWRVILLMDGSYVMEEYFQLGSSTIYNNNAKMLINSYHNYNA